MPAVMLVFVLVILLALCSAVELYSDIPFDVNSDEHSLNLLSRFVLGKLKLHTNVPLKLHITFYKMLHSILKST